MELAPQITRFPTSSVDTFSVIGSERYAPILSKRSIKTKAKKTEWKLYSTTLTYPNQRRLVSAMPMLRVHEFVAIYGAIKLCGNITVIYFSAKIAWG